MDCSFIAPRRRLRAVSSAAVAATITIQGFATEISVDQGETVFFKINTLSSQYRLDIFRMGYDRGMGARKVATVSTSTRGVIERAVCPQYDARRCR